MDYGDYLRLDTLLGAQHGLTEEHDELLFIVIHQATELWLKLSIHEIESAMGDVREDALRVAFKKLSRVARVQAHMIQAWEILATMTPFDYAHFRDSLGASSGFQSFQYRELEFILGNKNAAMLAVHKTSPGHHALLERELHAPSIYDEAVRLLARSGLAIAPGRLDADPTQPTVHDDTVMAAWLDVYRDPEHHWALYELAEKLVDLETAFRFWRFRHVSTVERIIGFKTGTGGTAGVSYLRKMLDVVLFPELFALRTAL